MSKDLIVDRRDGFGLISKWVMLDPSININSKAIYAYLCTFAGQTGQAFPSVNNMSHHLGVSRQTINKYVNDLVDVGVITKDQVRTSGRFSHNVYYLNSRSEAKKIRDSTAVNFTDNGETDDDKTDDGLTDDDNIATNNNSFKNNSFKKNSVNTNDQPKVDQSNPYSESFERWWAEYPRKQGKRESMRIWKREELGNRVDELIAKIRDQVANCKNYQDPEFIKHGSTYLNQGCYDDEIEAITNATNISSNKKESDMDRARRKLREQREELERRSNEDSQQSVGIHGGELRSTMDKPIF